MEENGKRRKKRKRMTGKMQTALWVVFCLFLVGILFVMIRVVTVGSNTGYAKASLSQKTGTDTVLQYKRGEITDRNGTVLAKSEKVYHLILDSRLLVKNEDCIEPTIRALCNVYGYSEAELRALIEEKKTSAYYRLRKDMTYEEMTAFEEYKTNLPKEEDGSPNKDKSKIIGVTFEEEYQRRYPYGSLASHVLGFAKADGDGTYGIEQQYNEELSGINGRIYDYYDANLTVQQEVIPASDGNVIVSTIDANLQRIVQKHTEAFLDEIGAKNVGVLMIGVNSGEVLAMQSNYSYDLNNPRSLSLWYTEDEIAAMDNDTYLNALYQVWRNFCISDSYEPGSTFKPFTVASALEEAVITTEETFLCDGGEKVSDYYISCHNKWGHGYVNAAQSIMHSCNDALMEIAKREGRTVFSKYQRQFLFGRLTRIDLPGEVAGILMEEEQLNETELATSSFGMSFNTTMIQLGAAFNSMVNGGIYYEPHVVKEIRNADGVVMERIEPRIVCRTISKDTSEFLRDAFYLTVQEGTATAAQVEGYLIGGKTGTAQKLPRSEGKYLVSFIGCVPADDPQVMIYVVVDEAADEELQDRASIASTLAADILEEALPYLKLYPDGEIKYPNFVIDEKDVEMQVGEIGDTGVVYDPEMNEGNMQAIPDDME
ncbi:MAG: penicillin-binding transpeptidase domain-containing protein [Lachnospiraceae bacterium]|nr:penicillin-binding transpeptidase domain-containing protein [Lachnospiraceae bacterium]